MNLEYPGADGAAALKVSVSVEDGVLTISKVSGEGFHGTVELPAWVAMNLIHAIATEAARYEDDSEES